MIDDYRSLCAEWYIYIAQAVTSHEALPHMRARRLTGNGQPVEYVIHKSKEE
jgi:hypothetical protein